MASVFDKVKCPTPDQLRSVSDRRFADAEALRDTGRNQHTNGAMYLAGIALECLLKAKALDLRPELGSAASSEALPEELRPLWFLVFRYHDLEALLESLPTIPKRIEQSVGPAESARLTNLLKRVCAEWTIAIGYSPRQAAREDAKVFLNRVKELRQWLR